MLLSYISCYQAIDRDDNAGAYLHAAVDFRLCSAPRCLCLPILTSPATPGYTHLPGDDDWAINRHRVLSTQCHAIRSSKIRSGMIRSSMTGSAAMTAKVRCLWPKQRQVIVEASLSETVLPGTAVTSPTFLWFLHLLIWPLPHLPVCDFFTSGYGPSSPTCLRFLHFLIWLLPHLHVYDFFTCWYGPSLTYLTIIS